jgi:hypothetical protein
MLEVPRTNLRQNKLGSMEKRDSSLQGQFCSNAGHNLGFFRGFSTISGGILAQCLKNNMTFLQVPSQRTIHMYNIQIPDCISFPKITAFICYFMLSLAMIQRLLKSCVLNLASVVCCCF